MPNTKKFSRLTALGFFALLSAGLFAPPAHGAEAPELGPLVEAYLAAADDAGRRQALGAVMGAKVAPDALQKFLETPRFEGDGRTGRYEIKLPGSETTTYVYVPSNYDPKRAWKTLVALHGMGGNGRQIIDPAQEIAERRQMIVIAPSLEPKFSNPAGLMAGAMGGNVDESFGWGDRPDCYALRALAWLKPRYHVDENRTFLMGVSMGGYGTWYAGTAYPHFWAALLPYAGGIALTENHPVIGRNEVRRRMLANLGNTPIYFVHGAKDSTVTPFGDRESDKDLKKLSYEYRYDEEPDWDHIPPKPEIPALVDRLLGWADAKTRKPWPRRLVFERLKQEHRLHFWLRIDEGSATARVEATVQGQGIALRGHGVRRLTVFLHPDLLSLKRAVTVAWEGQAVFRAKPQTSLEALLESWREWRDRAMVAPALVSFAVP